MRQKGGAKSRLNFEEFHSLAIPPSVKALTPRVPRRIYPAVVRIRGGCDMIAEWILLYAVVFILCAVVVGHAPTKH